jgi:hypothetical protein
MPAPGDNTTNLAQCLRDEVNEIAEAMTWLIRETSHRVQYFQALSEESQDQLFLARQRSETIAI